MYMMHLYTHTRTHTSTHTHTNTHAHNALVNIKYSVTGAIYNSETFSKLRYIPTFLAVKRMYRYTGIRYNTGPEIKRESEYIPVRSNLEKLKEDNKTRAEKNRKIIRMGEKMKEA